MAARLERLNERVDAGWERWSERVDARLKPSAQRADARPVMALAVSAGLLAVCVAVPGMGVGNLLGGPAKAGDGIDGAEMFGCAFCLLLIASFGVAVWWLPRRWFGVGRRRSAAVTVAAVTAGLLPWLSWHGPSVFGDTFGPVHEPLWAALFFGTGVLVLPATALLLVGDRRARTVGAVVLAVAACLWWPARQGLLAAGAADTLRDLGGPPRAEVQLVRWWAAAPGGTAYRSGTLVVRYLGDGPSPDAWSGGLAVSPVQGGGTDADFCAAARRALRTGDTEVFGRPAPTDPSCLPYAAGLWQVGDHALAKRAGGWSVVVIDDPDEAADFGDLAAALATAHPADDAELRYLDTGPITS